MTNTTILSEQQMRGRAALRTLPIHAGLSPRGPVAGTILRVRDRLAEMFRRKRMDRFEKRFPSASYPQIVDVGGTFSFWEGTHRQVTIVNPGVPATVKGPLTSVQGDGRSVPFPDRSFTLAFSNSAIEHIPSREGMQSFARELSRVGVAIYCQTPNKWFPFDAHYLCLLLHWWPRLLRNYYVARYLTGWGWAFRPDRKAVREWAAEVNLLAEDEFRSLFPDCTIERETFLGLAKSFIAIRVAEQ